MSIPFNRRPPGCGCMEPTSPCYWCGNGVVAPGTMFPFQSAEMQRRALEKELAHQEQIRQEAQRQEGAYREAIRQEIAYELHKQLMPLMKTLINEIRKGRREGD